MILNGQKVIYVTREIERALGITPNPDYLIVSNKTPYGETIREKYPESVFLIDPEGGLLGTTELLGHPLTKELMGKYPQAKILVFKNTLRVETVIKANNWTAVNPPSRLAERVENKISQTRWLGNIGEKYLPPHTVKLAKLITWRNDPFVLQWAHGHTGDGTILIRNYDDLSAVQSKFPDRIARITTYIAGPSFTVNVIVSDEKILMGNIDYQITGLAPFTDNEFSTIGNDWGVATKMLSDNDVSSIKAMVAEIGQKLHNDGWRGLFGIDIIRDDLGKRMYLIEINARQPASATFESSLQEELRGKGQKGLTTFEAHLRALLGEKIDEELIAMNNGAQIVQRVTKNIQGVFDDVSKELRDLGFSVVSYQNSDYNSDLLRIQSDSSIMNGHKEFNDRGHKIVNAVRNSQIKIQV